MQRYSVITLFSDLIAQYAQTSILGRAQQRHKIQVQTMNPRDFAPGPYHKVDDAPYGGGVGMVMMCPPLVEAYESLLPLPEKHRVILTSPGGRVFHQNLAQEYAQQEHLILICGHYEGVDARVQELIPHLEVVSLGDFVLTGGELAALAIMDATARLLPGVLGKDESSVEESFSSGLLEYPHYTRPANYRGMEVPAVLLSGHHEQIRQWRTEMSLQQTQQYRPDLL